ncbi:MAG: transglutaminase-like domain-containing protein [Pirellulaceae bacterium]|nr:transglutaminase-like domain-containing protein [Pirellulaceae bacterium]
MRASRLSENRRRIGAIVLAVIAIGALVRLRSTCEAYGVLAVDIGLNALLVIGTAWMVARASAPGRQSTATKPTITRNPQTLMMIGATASVLFPLLANTVERKLGEGTGTEIAYMSVLAWGGLVAAVFAKLNRTISISVVCSGFLTLFTTVSSDHQSAVYYAFLWGLVCLWWLIANHWERVESCQIDTVSSNKVRMPLAIVAGSVVFLVAAWSASGRSVMFNRLQAELMPTSGGTSMSDSSARSGVGDGDAVVAARDHAASFGAVETDVFLDSPQPSLFDIFNETFGEPVRKKKSERAIALEPRGDQSTSSRTAQSNTTTQSFTIHRSDPKRRKPLKDVASNAAMYWIGRAGERLATQRYTHFDGVEWHQTVSPASPRIFEQKIGDRVWFGADANNGLALGPFVESNAEAIKFTKFRSNRIPAPAGVEMWHIDKVDQADFFGFSSDRCLEMPGRDFVPDYTTVRLVNRSIDLEKLAALTKMCPGVSVSEHPSAGDLANDAGVLAAKQLVQGWIPNPLHEWENVQLVVDRLRSEFTFERTNETASPSATGDDSADRVSDVSPLQKFFASRRGNDVMFATAAAVMLREIGFRTRFVTGFYVDPQQRDRLTGQTPITTQDAHAWLEVDVGMDTWIPLEPTPGFLQPSYRVSLAYRLRQNSLAIIGTCAGLMVTTACLWLSRAYLFELLCRLLSFVLPWVSDRRRVRWLVGVLDRRCRLAGMARPQSIPPREWLLQCSQAQPATWTNALIRFFNEADRLNFGSGSSLSVEGRQACVQLWREVNTFVLRRSKSINLNGGLGC